MFKCFKIIKKNLLLSAISLILLLTVACNPYNNEYEKSLGEKFSILNKSNLEFDFEEPCGLDTCYYLSIYKLDSDKIDKLKNFKVRSDYVVDTVLAKKALESMICRCRVQKLSQKNKELLDLCASQTNLIFFSRWPLSHLVDEKEPNWILISGYVIMPDINSVANIQVEVSDDSKRTPEQKKRYLDHMELLEETLEKEGKLNSEIRTQLKLQQEKLEKEIESDKSNKLDKR